MNTCERYAELISGMIDGELSGEEQRSVLAHIEQCESCRRMYEAFSLVSSAIGDEMVEPPEELSEKVMASVRREAVKRKNTKRKQLWRVLTAAACVALVCAFVLPGRLLRADSAAPEAAVAGGKMTARVLMAPDQAAPAEMPAAPMPMPEPAPESREPEEGTYGTNTAETGEALKASDFEEHRLSPWQFEQLCELLGHSEIVANIVDAETVCRFVSDAGDTCTVYHDGLVLYFSLNEDEQLIPAACGLDEINAYIASLEK